MPCRKKRVCVKVQRGKERRKEGKGKGKKLGFVHTVTERERSKGASRMGEEELYCIRKKRKRGKLRKGELWERKLRKARIKS